MNKVQFPNSVPVTLLLDLTLNFGGRWNKLACQKKRPFHWGGLIRVTKFSVRSRNVVKISSSGTILYTVKNRQLHICNLCFISIRNQPHVALHYWPRRILKSQCWGFNFLTFCQNQTLQLLRCVYLALDWNFITFMFPSGSLKMQLELFRVPIFCYRKVLINTLKGTLIFEFPTPTYYSFSTHYPP